MSLTQVKEKIKQDIKKIKVKALPAFHYRRLITLNGLSQQQFRDLQAGKIVEINQKYFDKNIYEKVKSDGNR